MKESKQFMVLIALISITSIYVYGIISGNDSCRAYRSGCGGGKEAATIKQYIIEGAGYYFKSHSYFQKLLNMVELSELSGFDYEEAKIIKAFGPVPFLYTFIRCARIYLSPSEMPRPIPESTIPVSPIPAASA